MGGRVARQRHGTQRQTQANERSRRLDWRDAREEREPKTEFGGFAAPRAFGELPFPFSRGDRYVRSFEPGSLTLGSPFFPFSVSRAPDPLAHSTGRDSTGREARE